MRYLLLVLMLLTQPIIAFELNINCGSNEGMKSYDNIVFSKDVSYDKSLGYGYVTIGEPPKYDSIQIVNIGNVVHSDKIFRTSIFGVDEYRIDVPDGKYFLNLYMYEPVHQVVGERVFSIVVESDTLIENLDIVKLFGSGKIIQIRRLVDVKDGTLNINFLQAKGRSILTAIRCYSAKDLDYPEGPENFDIIPSYGANAFFFRELHDEIAYYNIYKKENNNFIKINSEVFSQTFIDDKIEGSVSTYRFSATDFYGNESELSDEYNVENISKNETAIPAFSIYIDEEDLDAILENKYADEYKDCLFSDGHNNMDAMVRLRGKSSRAFHKKSWRIKFNEYNEYEDTEKLNFLSLIFDPSLIRESLFHEILKEEVEFELGYKYINLFVNDKYMGVYLLKEQEDNEFLEKYDIDTAAVYKGTNSNTMPKEYYDQYEISFEIQNNYDGGFHLLDDFFTFVDTASVEVLEDKIEDIFYVSDFIKTRATINYLADVDQCNQNYILIYEFDNKKWRFLTYDNNFSLFNTQQHILCYTKEHTDAFGCVFNIFDKILQIPKYKYLFLSKVKQLAFDKCTPEQINRKIDSTANYIREDVYKDYNKYSHANNDVFENDIHTLKEYFVKRSELVSQQLDEISGVEIPDGITINEIMTNNISAVETQSGKYQNWIEFYNANNIDIDLTDFKLEIEQSASLQTFNFPINSVVKANSYRVFSFDKTLSATTHNIDFDVTPAAGKIRLLYANNEVLADEVVFPALPINNSYAELDNVSDNWITFTIHTYNASNLGMEKLVTIFINEFMPKNDSTWADEYGEYEDWIELFNPNNFEVDLSGYFLSDELEELDKWEIPDGIVIEPNGYLLFWADKDEEQGKMHIDFKLSGDSGYVILTNPLQNYICDSVFYIDADSDESFVRNGDGMPEWIKARVPTPNRSNIYFDSNTRYLLKNVYPNPADDILNIYFVLHRNKNIKVRVCDYSGKTIKELYNAKCNAGEYSLQLDVSEISQGVYFLYFETKDYYEVKPFVIIR